MPVQRHIHLGLSVASTGERAPTMKWKTTQRQEVARVQTSVKVGLTGKLQKHVLSDVSGPLVYTDLRYALKVDESYQGYSPRDLMDLIQSYLGRTLYLVDHYHPDDGADHSNYVRQVFMSTSFSFDTVEPGLRLFYVPVEFTDDRI